MFIVIALELFFLIFNDYICIYRSLGLNQHTDVIMCVTIAHLNKHNSGDRSNMLVYAKNGVSNMVLC